ncbi:MAG: EAL domain-containing protein, partial [Acidimicrobiales bacterium]
ADRLLTPIAVIAPDSTLLYANDVAIKLFDLEKSQVVGRKAVSFVHPDDRERVTEELNNVVSGVCSGGFSRFRFRGGTAQAWRVFDSYVHNLVDDPDIRGVLISGADATEQELLSRALNTLSQSNRLLIHATDEATLVDNICETITSSGKYLLAWVGYVGNDPDKTVNVVAARGATDYLKDLTVRWGEDQYGQGPTGRAVRTGSLQVTKDVRRSKKCEPWRDRLEEFGVRATCVLPLNVGGATIGALTIYSRDPGTFGDAEIELLKELADNLSYGIGRLRDAESLMRNEAHLREAERLAHVGHWEWNIRTNHLEFMADEMYSIYGITRLQWPRTYESFLSFVVPQDRPAFQEAIDETLATGSAELIHRIVAYDGENRVVRMRTELVAGKDGLPERIVGVSLDVSIYILAKQELNQSRQFLLAITNNMAEGMIATDGEGVITFANAAAGKLFRLDPSDLVGRQTHDAFQLKGNAAPSTEEAGCPLKKVWAEGQSLIVSNDVVIRHDGSSVPVAYSASPLMADGLSGAVIVFEDITERANEQIKAERELEKLAWVGRIRDSLDNGRFVLYSQPIVDLSTYEVIQHELLIRMISPEGDVVMPDEFLPTAEEYGLVTEIDRWVINETARLAALGHAVEFNVSAKSVTDPNMLAMIVNAIEAHGAPPENMVCEITETALVRDIEAAEVFVRGLNEVGCQVALDDFGAGYGGFNNLKRLAVSYIKIDREFVRDLRDELSSQHVVAAVVNLARAFGMQTIAEGAEDDETLRLLRELGVNHVQGYVIGRPAPASEALAGN